LADILTPEQKAQLGKVREEVKKRQPEKKTEKN
jgi:hypothetical protein